MIHLSLLILSDEYIEPPIQVLKSLFYEENSFTWTNF